MDKRLISVSLDENFDRLLDCIESLTDQVVLVERIPNFSPSVLQGLRESRDAIRHVLNALLKHDGDWFVDLSPETRARKLDMQSVGLDEWAQRKVLEACRPKL